MLSGLSSWGPKCVEGKGIMNKQRFFTCGVALRSLSGCILLMLLGLTQSAYATTLTFDTYTNLDSNHTVSDGYAFTSFGAGYDFGLLPVGGGGIYDAANDDNIFRAYVDTPGGDAPLVFFSVSMSREDGESFSLLTLDLLDGVNYGTGDFFLMQGNVEILGSLAGGGTISTYDVTELGQGGWLNITSVDFQLDSGSAGLQEQLVIYLDDIEVGASVVPLPAAVWLFGSSLGLLGWFRRKQSISSHSHQK